MSNNKKDKIVNVNGKKVMMVNIAPVKNTRNVNSLQKKQPIQTKQQTQSASRKQIKTEVNLLEDTDTDTDDIETENDSENIDSESSQEIKPKRKKMAKTNSNKTTKLSFQDKGYKDYQEKNKGNPNPASVFVNPEDIKKKLEFYKRVQTEDLANIPLGMRIKYVEILDNGTYKYKPGGVVIVNKAPDYLVLTGNRKSWSVQLANHIIFVEEYDLVRKNYEQKIKNLNNQIEKLKQSNNKLQNDLKNNSKQVNKKSK
jgi:hypothetical protein